MISSKFEKWKINVPNVEQDGSDGKSKEKNFGVGYVGYDKNKKPIALILDVDPPSLEPSQILETLPKVKKISEKKIEFAFLK